METTLVVMAAGMGSRFGGLKQMEPIGPGGEFLMDFSAFDAKEAGFSKVVFVIKKEMEEDFKRIAVSRIQKYIDVDYVFQSMDDLPAGRTKPWGTGHAILCCKDKVTTPFAIINADDYYGKAAYVVLNDALKEIKKGEMFLVGYDLAQTTTENGTVTRGVCKVEDGYLTGIRETKGISGFTYCEDGETVHNLPEDTIVSMNMWGFGTEIFDYLEREFEVFKNEKDVMKEEYLIPIVVDDLIKKGEAKVKVLRSPDRWYGMTYREDKETVMAEMKKLCEAGKYNGIS
ncbi:MAG: nucleotidyltransferase [Clostridia bacterium]|nr:nucleotidyltransferase [Clostridia bacterium]